MTLARKLALSISIAASLAAVVLSVAIWLLLEDQAYSFASAKDTSLKVIAAVLVVIAIGATFAILSVIRVIRPIKSLTAVTRNIAAGDLTHRVTKQSNDEYGQLAVSFNAMADRLQQVYEGLESKVAEKTVELGQKVTEIEAEKVKDEALLSSIGEGMIAIDADGRVIKINSTALSMLGVAPEAIFGKRIEDVVAFRDEQGGPVAAQYLPGSIARNHGQKTEDTFLVTANGSAIAVSITSSPVRIQHHTAGVIMVMRDVTREREVDRMKTEFISLASHQLRTPLSAIRWFSEMLVSGDAGELNQMQKEFAQNVAESTDRMIALVGSLLNISRIESGRIVVDPRPTDLEELIHNIVRDLGHKIQERQQNLAVSVHADLPKVNLDPRMVGQVYLNLLTNAIKYTPSGGDIVVIVSRKDDQIISQVSDNGYGIPKEQQGKVFQKFFRADNIVKLETDGTGLGLYLAKAIVESSGGKIWFGSEEGKGTTFWFSLPVSGMKAKTGEVRLNT